MVSSSPEVSSASDLKADDPEKAQPEVETIDLAPTANRSSHMPVPSVSEAGAHSESDNNTPPPYDELSRNDNATDSYPGSGDISPSDVTSDRRFRSTGNAANNGSSGWNIGRKCTFSPLHLAIMVLGILSAVLAVSRLPNVAPQSAAQARIRDEWDKEVHAHEALRAELQHQMAEWEHERLARVQRRQEEEVEWDKEIHAHEAVRAELQHRKAEWEHERLAQVQRRQEGEVEWDKEIQAHEALRAELQHQKAEWERERLAQVQRRQEEEMEWDQAREALRAGLARKRDEVEALRADLQREKVQWIRQRAAEKRRKEEELARVRAGFRWEDLTPDQRCLRHNARGYTARLAKVPRSYDPIQACEETAIVIPGVEIKGRPLKCEDRVRHPICECSISSLILAWGCSGVFGHWIAESGESICATYFKHFDDKGCTSPGSRRRRIQSRLENLQFGDDGRKMCSTTPATFRHQHFPKPDMCDVGIFGVWGVWEIKDPKC